MKKNTLLLTLTILIIALLPNLASADYTAIFNDTFIRADNPTVGNGWTEAASGGTSAASIDSNNLRMLANSGGFVFVNRTITAISPSKTNLSFQVTALPTGSSGVYRLKNGTTTGLYISWDEIHF
jgi:hypothetical protein